MKKLVLLFSLVLIGFSCTQKGQYTLTGTTSVAELEGQNVYLVKYNAEGAEVEKADTVLVKDGKFAFKGVQETPEIYYLLTDNQDVMKKRAILLEPGKLTVTIADAGKITVAGTPVNDSYQQLADGMWSLQDQMSKIEEKAEKAQSDSLMTPEMEASLEKESDAVYEQMKGAYTTYLVGNINNPLGQDVFKSWGRRLNADQLALVMGKADEVFKASEMGVSSQERLQNMQNTAVGQTFTDIKSKTPDGKDIALSDYAGKGKYVLVDFWASWCPPCRAEMPNLVALYKQYKGEKFEIVGYSLDKEDAAWKKGLADLGMSWPQMSDIKFWQSEPVKLYAVQGIPHTILLDPNGIIIAKDLRGDALTQKLTEVLK